MKIIIVTKPADELKNPTTGDYWRDTDGTANVAVQELGDEDYEFLIGIHSLIEGKLIEHNKINIQKIAYFNEEFKLKRGDSPRIPGDDPGDDPLSPYHREHIFATFIEMQIAKEFNISWKT